MKKSQAGRIRRAIRAVLCLLSVLSVAVLHDLAMRICVLPFFKRGTPTWHRLWSDAVRRWGVWTAAAARIVGGVRVEVEGKVPGSQRYLVVVNHQSSIDIPLLIDVLRPLDLKFVADEFLRYGKPAVSLGLRNSGAVFLEKKNRREDLRRLKRFAESLEALGGSAVIFPEGGRSRDGRMEPFRIAGTRKIREASGLPILPVVHDGLWRARSIKTTHQLVETPVRFRILAPVLAERFEADPKAAYAEVEASMRRALAEMRGDGSPRHPAEFPDGGS